jgi:histone acetyltransferase (RNA polymerase elongator complex component)
MVKLRILPFFIPMEGCPHTCIYCDQVAISGKSASPKAEEIAAALAAFPADGEAELAFYGGSFTCLPHKRQLYYLDAAIPALREMKIKGIRISTRPDAVDDETCAFLKEHGVVTVELGIQSFDASVLAAAERGYDPQVAELACLAVKKAGLRLGVQLMTGLPQDDPVKDLQAVGKSGELGAELLRIYPTLVLAHTQLAALYSAGKYTPQTLDAAVACCRDMAMMAIAMGMTLIRVGINPSLDVEAAMLAGPYHPAFGGLVKEAVKKAQIADILAGYDVKEAAALFFAKEDQPLLWGQGGAGIRELGRNYPLLALLPGRDLPRGALRLVAGARNILSTEREFCQNAGGKHTPIRK